MLNTYAVLRSELLVEGSRHDLSSDVGGGIEVSLALSATRRGDHLEVYAERGLVEDGWW